MLLFVLVFYICGCYVVFIFISVTEKKQNRDDGCAHSIIQVNVKLLLFNIRACRVPFFLLTAITVKSGAGILP